MQGLHRTPLPTRPTPLATLRSFPPVGLRRRKRASLGAPRRAAAPPHRAAPPRATCDPSPPPRYPPPPAPSAAPPLRPRAPAAAVAAAARPGLHLPRRPCGGPLRRRLPLAVALRHPPAASGLGSSHPRTAARLPAGDAAAVLDAAAATAASLTSGTRDDQFVSRSARAFASAFAAAPRLRLRRRLRPRPRLRLRLRLRRRLRPRSRLLASRPRLRLGARLRLGLGTRAALAPLAGGARARSPRRSSAGARARPPQRLRLALPTLALRRRRARSSASFAAAAARSAASSVAHRWVAARKGPAATPRVCASVTSLRSSAAAESHTSGRKERTGLSASSLSFRLCSSTIRWRCANPFSTGWYAAGRS